MFYKGMTNFNYLHILIKQSVIFEWMKTSFKKAIVFVRFLILKF